MKTILTSVAIFMAVSTVKAQKSWVYQNQKNAKGSISGEFTYQEGKNWTETNNLEGPFKFEEYKSNETDIIIFDKKRNVYVKLSLTEMYASWGSDNKWEKYYTGHWKNWAYANQEHSKGKISGKFIYLGGKKWIEKNNIEGPFQFEEYEVSSTEVILYDKSRNVYVKLTPTEMYAS